MTSSRIPLLVAAGVLLVGTLGCADVQDRVGELGASASELEDRARFCLSVTRTLAAAHGGSPATAATAAEEALAQAPEDLRDDARVVAEALRSARDGDSEPFADPEVQAAAERLREATKDLCDPVDTAD